MIYKKIKDKINLYRQEISASKRKKELNKQIDAHKFEYLQPTCILSKEWYGSVYGGFFVHPERINEKSIIYSFGIGKDITFDKKCIKNHQCTVFGFDPTPKSIEWVQQQKVSEKFNFFNYGISVISGIQHFYLPKNNKSVSGSLVMNETVNEDDMVAVNMQSFAAIIQDLKHNEIEVLKMDIEGAEYDVIDSILAANITINQFLVEFHDRIFPTAEPKSKAFVEKMKANGFEIFAVSDSFEEVSFIRKSALTPQSL